MIIKTIIIIIIDNIYMAHFIHTQKQKKLLMKVTLMII